ncbi:DMT family transporter [Pseudohalocynthiibacter aestuariivivens]|jgi:drug/metabolite transporter (DMT)-like permease|uniref:DMT family transporter n=1 Tax=Pseudohalocynthiibacter aestuariivivens TaxID=1591409 RepID=A0ABV5JE26_9RHOB|nr:MULTISPECIES: DMT family transporter [Pseudohalocynthiibacter]MCK0103415.1 DMT family transporter [Pseudohalocynthiibacter sp. F2068]
MGSVAAKSDRVVLGVLCMMTFSIFGPLIDAFAKLVPSEIPVGQIIAARFAVQGIMLLPMAAMFGWLHRPNNHELGLHIVRAALILLATGCFVAAIRVMPLADAIAIFFVEPFILTLLGGFLLGEAIGPRRIMACLVGFCGALLVIKPSFAAFGPVAMFPLGTAFCFAFYMVLTRRMAVAMHPVTLQAYTAIAAIGLAFPVLWFFDGSGSVALDPTFPERYGFLMLLGVGMSATIAHIFVSFALSLAPAATIAPFQYLEIVAATALGYWIFSDLPDALTFLGIAIIVGSGIYVFTRERRLSRLPTPPP